MLKNICLAISGASGSPYAINLLKQLTLHDVTIHLLISDAAKEVFRLESQIELPESTEQIKSFFLDLCQTKNDEQIQYYGASDWLSPVASGSNAADAMVICPCSMGSLSSIAHGASNNLIERAADVMLKEKRQLILVPREMPLSSIHLENMLKLSQMNVTIMPASPGFYHQPQSIDDLVNFVVARILDQLKLPQQLQKPWGS